MTENYDLTVTVATQVIETYDLALRLDGSEWFTAPYADEVPAICIEHCKLEDWHSFETIGGSAERLRGCSHPAVFRIKGKIDEKEYYLVDTLHQRKQDNGDYMDYKAIIESATHAPPHWNDRKLPEYIVYHGLLYKEGRERKES